MSDIKFMDDKDINDVTLEQLIKQYLNNTNELKSLDYVSEFYDTVDRSLFIGDVTPEVGDAIEHVIRIIIFLIKKFLLRIENL